MLILTKPGLYLFTTENRSIHCIWKTHVKTQKVMVKLISSRIIFPTYYYNSTETKLSFMNKNPQNTIRLSVAFYPHVHKEYCEVKFNSSCFKNALHKIPKLKIMPILKKCSLSLHKSSGVAYWPTTSLLYIRD